MLAMLVALFGVFLSFDSFALDINYPFYRCDKGNYMALVGFKSRNEKKPYIALYKWTKISHPGHGEVSYPGPVFGSQIVLKRDQAITADYFSSKDARLTVLTEGDEMAGEELKLKGKLLFLSDENERVSITGFTCVYTEENDWN